MYIWNAEFHFTTSPKTLLSAIGRQTRMSHTTTKPITKIIAFDQCQAFFPNPNFPSFVLTTNRRPPLLVQPTDQTTPHQTISNQYQLCPDQPFPYTLDVCPPRHPRRVITVQQSSIYQSCNKRTNFIHQQSMDHSTPCSTVMAPSSKPCPTWITKTNCSLRSVPQSGSVLFITNTSNNMFSMPWR